MSIITTSKDKKKNKKKHSNKLQALKITQFNTVPSFSINCIGFVTKSILFEAKNKLKKTSLYLHRIHY